MISIFNFLLFCAIVYVLYQQYKALFELTSTRFEDFNPTKKYWWKCAIPFYALYLVIAGEIRDFKNKRNAGNS